MNLASPSTTCTDDCHPLHLLEEFWDLGVVSRIQTIAVDSQVELQPGGAGVVGHLVVSHGDIGHSSRLTVQLHMSNR